MTARLGRDRGASSDGLSKSKEKRRKIVAKSCLLSLKRSAKGLQARFKVRQLIDFTPLSRLGECSVRSLAFNKG